MSGSLGAILRECLACVVFLVAVALSTGTGFAQAPPPISIEPASMSLPVRSDAPITVFFTIRSQATNLIEGHLEVTVADGVDKLAEVQVSDIVVSAGDQLVRVVLPPIESNNPLHEVGLKVTFVGKGVRVSPPAFALRAMGQWERGLVLLISDPRQATLGRDKQQLIESLRFENWIADKSDRTVRTFPAHVRPEEMPGDPLGYCGFDVALLAGQGFSDLKESQLRALFDWVAAGGSACVVPGDNVLKDYHVRLLNQIVPASGSDGPFLLDAAGKLSNRDDGEPGPLTFRHGLGRVAVVPGSLDSLLGRPSELREMLAFLWKLRRDRLEEFVAKGIVTIVHEELPTEEPAGTQQLAAQAQMQIQKAQTESLQAQNELAQARQTGDQAAMAQAQAKVNQAQMAMAQAQSQLQGAYRNPRNFSYQTFRPKEYQLAQLPLKSGDQLVSRLMPEGLRFVPMSLIGLILALYVVLIGPGDWFVLGAIRRRKWTWFTFPAVTVGLTLATVWLAEWYMQVNDNKRAVIVHDLGNDGKVVRRNRFEVLFLGSEREVHTELAREIFSPMTLQRFSEATWVNYQQSQLQGQERKQLPGVARYTGRIPAHYTVAQFITQWTPQLNRRFAIPLGENPPVELDWNRFADASKYNFASLTSGEVRNEVVAAVQQAFGPAANIAVLSGGKRQNLTGSFQFLESGGVYGVDPYGNSMARTATRYNPNEKKTDFLEDISANSLGGFFNVVSQTSPAGGKDFEDLALLDPSDSDQWLLLIAVDRGAEVDVYRKLYTKGK